MARKKFIRSFSISQDTILYVSDRSRQLDITESAFVDKVIMAYKALLDHEPDTTPDDPEKTWQEAIEEADLEAISAELTGQKKNI